MNIFYTFQVSTPGSFAVIEWSLSGGSQSQASASRLLGRRNLQITGQSPTVDKTVDGLGWRKCAKRVENRPLDRRIYAKPKQTVRWYNSLRGAHNNYGGIGGTDNKCYKRTVVSSWPVSTGGYPGDLQSVRVISPASLIDKYRSLC